VIRIGPSSGAVPHILYSDPRRILGLAFSPDGKWVASSGGTTIRLWPMPDLSKPPVHTLPHDVLLAKLKNLTNLRAVSDPRAASGYRVAIGPFPGWKDNPTW